MHGQDKAVTDINRSKDNDGKTALMLAALIRHADTVKLFVEKGADVNIRDKGGRTALSLAKEFGRINIAQILVDAGAISEKTE